MVEEDVEEDGGCQQHSKRFMCKGLFLALQVDCHLMEGWIISVYEYIRDIYKIYSIMINNHS